MAKTDPVNISDPSGLSDPKLGDDYIRTLARASIELVNKDHFIGVATNGAYDEDDAGEHTKITFHAPLADNPAGKTVNSDETATDAHEGYLYLKNIANSDEDDVAELHFQDENGNHIQMSAEGYNYLEKPLIPNNTVFKAYNAAKDGFVELFKCNASGEFEFMVKAKLLADTTAIASSTLAFTSGSTKIVATNIITGVSSGHTATVKSIILSSGSWAGGDAAGSMQLNNVTGSFTNGEELSVGAATEIATAGTFTAGEADNIATEGYVDQAITDSMEPTAYSEEESITFGNGLIIKHGVIAQTSNETTVTFKEEFPNSILSIQLTGEKDDSQQKFCPYIQTYTTEEMVIYQPNNYGFTNIHWMAIGN